MRGYHTTFGILLTAIILTLITLITAPTLIDAQTSSTATFFSNVHIILALASAAALCMTLWLVIVGKILGQWFPLQLTSPRAIGLLTLGCGVIFLATGAELYIQRTMGLPPTLSLLLNLLRITPVFLLLTYLMPAATKPRTA